MEKETRPAHPFVLRLVAVACFWAGPFVPVATYFACDQMMGAPYGHAFEYGIHGALFAFSFLADSAAFSTLGFMLAQVLTPGVVHRHRWRFWCLSAVAGMGAVLASYVLFRLIPEMVDMPGGPVFLSAGLILTPFAICAAVFGLAFMVGWLQVPVTDGQHGTPEAVLPE